MTAAAGAPIWMEALVRSAIALPFLPLPCPMSDRGRAGRGPSAGGAPPALLGSGYRVALCLRRHTRTADLRCANATVVRAAPPCGCDAFAWPETLATR